MGQDQSKPLTLTHVANCYHEDIYVCVKANSIEVYEEEIGIEGNIGAFGVNAGSAYNNRQRRRYVKVDPGFSTIKPDDYLEFAEAGDDGRVFVTIKIGSDIPYANFQVHNGRNLLVNKKGSLRIVKQNDIRTDAEGKKHLAENANMELISPANVEDSDEVLRRYRDKGRVKKYFGTEGNAVGQMKWPFGICSTTSDDLVVADTFNNRIQIFDVNGKVKGIFGSKGGAEGQFDCVYDVCVTSRGWIVASDSRNHRIQIFDEQGRFVREFGSKGSGDGKLDIPRGVATDDKGQIYVCDRHNHRVQVFSEDGKFVRKFGSESLKDPNYLSLTSNGNVVVSNNHNVQVFDANGRHLFQFGSEGMNESQFMYPQGVATDQHGNIIVCDNDNRRVQIFTNCGQFVSCFGSEGSKLIKGPRGVCVLSDGRIAVCDCGNNRIQIF